MLEDKSGNAVSQSIFFPKKLGLFLDIGFPKNCFRRCYDGNFTFFLNHVLSYFCLTDKPRETAKAANTIQST